MSVPMNQQDYERFKQIAAIFAEELAGEISVYVGTDGYASIEMRGKINDDKLRGVFWPTSTVSVEG